jgi:hypothetical protein
VQTRLFFHHGVNNSLINSQEAALLGIIPYSL